MKSIFFFKIAIVLICIGGRMTSAAQVCTGSLGDPVVNVNFGSGVNPGNQLQAASTTYNFTSSICPNDGSYTVVNSTAGCFNSSWHTIAEDHTPNDASGYIMLVNASVTPGDFYVDTVKNLCANTTFEFAAWILNVLLPNACGSNPIRPKLTFTIETITGAVLGSYSTGDIASSGTPTWKQYGLFFTTPINTNSVVIRLTNTAPGGCGNDLALDDITFRPCGPSVSTSVANNSQTTANLCKGGVTNIPLTANIGNGYIVPALQWQESSMNGNTWADIAGANSPSYQFTKTAVGVYKYRLSVAEGTNIVINNCRVASNIITITIHDIPVATAASNSPVCEKRAINLSATGGITYAWTGPAGFSAISANPSFPAQTNSPGQYIVTVTDSFGCNNTASVSVITLPKPLASISNTQTFCEGNTVSLLAGGGIAYLWSPATGLSGINIPNPIASPGDTTNYSVVVFSANNCTDTATVTMNVIKRPTANAGPDKILLRGLPVVLDGSAGGSNVSFNWSPVTFLNDPLLIQPVATPLQDIRYTLNVISNDGCGLATDEVIVKVYDDIYIPTAFSPNNDGLNDTWRIEALIVAPNASVIIFNRYGKIIFETTGNSKQWDGTYKGISLPVGAYTYMIDLKNGKPLIKGTVMIVR
ncbi:MAG: gliding motility-associated C-terminal domain-containing protein [Ferruginibacter sp.]|nr:gliding motility-associated C-terminal domain-containing protein [Ferruginibacter sp.]